MSKLLKYFIFFINSFILISIIFFFHFALTNMNELSLDSTQVDITLYSQPNAQRGSEIKTITSILSPPIKPSQELSLSSIQSIKISSAMKDLIIILKNSQTNPKKFVNIIIGSNIQPNRPVIIDNLKENKIWDGQVQVIVSNPNGGGNSFDEVEVTTSPFLITHPPAG